MFTTQPRFYLTCVYRLLLTAASLQRSLQSTVWPAAVRSRTVARVADATAAARVDVLTETETVWGRQHALSGGVRRNPRTN